jgi:hypothetical protein
MIPSAQLRHLTAHFFVRVSFASIQEAVYNGAVRHIAGPYDLFCVMLVPLINRAVLFTFVIMFVFNCGYARLKQN